MKIPHVEEQLSPCATTAKPVHLEHRLNNKRNYCNEKPMHHSED